MGEQDKSRRTIRDVESDALGRTAAKGGLIIVAGSLLRLALTLGSIAVLARLLTPSDFGLMAMVWPLILLLTWIGDMGLTMATIQRKDFSHAQASFFFWLNLGIGVALSLLVVASAPLAGWFYDEPRVTAISMAMALCFPLNALAGQHKALLRRTIRMTEFALIELVSTAIGVAAGVSAALQGLGYWALVILPLAQFASAAVLYWIPSWPRWSADMARSLGFGMNLTGSVMLNFLTKQLDNVLIGWRFGEAALGPYAFAYRLVMLPKLYLIDAIGHAIVPALSRLQDAPERYRGYFLGVSGTLLYVLWPALAGAGVMADVLVLAFAGPQWGEAAEIFSVLVILCMVMVGNEIANWIYFSLGRTDRQLRWDLRLTPIVLLSFVIGLPFGAYGVAVAVTTVYAAAFIPVLNYIFRDGPVTIGAFARTVRPALIATAAVAGTLFAWRLVRPDLAVWWDLAASMSLGAAAFALTSAWLFGVRSAPARLRQIRDMLRGKTEGA